MLETDVLFYQKVDKQYGVVVIAYPLEKEKEIASKFDMENFDCEFIDYEDFLNGNKKSC